jgi:hypothetical protein
MAWRGAIASDAGDASAEAGGSDVSEGVVDRDQRYRRVLEALERLEASWRSQPADVSALRTRLDALRAELSALRAAAVAAPAPAPAPAVEETARSGSKPAPGRVRLEPGEVPSEAEAAEMRRRQSAATMGTHLPGPPLPGATGPLAGVPEDWIRLSSERAAAELDAIEASLQRGAAGRSQVEPRLRSLREELERIAVPPAGTPPVDPAKAPREPGR